jgi:periplasmic divalent cation tolerance protein
MPDTEAIIVFMTTGNREEAARLAEMLVQGKLAACVQILPQIESVYRWQGKIERQAEVLLIAKTCKSRFAALEREVRVMHSYETPEIMAVTVAECSGPYLEWLIDSVAASSEAAVSARQE